MQNVIITQKANEVDWVGLVLWAGRFHLPQLLCFLAVTLELTRRNI
jgi:hypothetical protein